MKYLAFDFGDGTTSAALCEGGEPVVQNIIGGVDEIPSVLNYCVGDDGRTRAVIGANAVNVGKTQAGLRMNWKSRPTQMEQTPGYSDNAKIADTTIFMQTVYREFLQQNPGAVDEQTRIVIGTPSAWTQEDRDIYATYAEKAGLRNVSVLSESQAAYLFAQKFLKDSNGNNLPSSIIRDGLLLVDVGSSTTDFTFARGMHAEHYGIALGAKYVDENLFKWGLSQSDADDNLLAALKEEGNREIRLRLVFRCRERKEEYFSQCHPGEYTQRVPNRVEELIGDDEVSFHLGDLEKGRTMSETLFQRILDDGCEKQYKIAVRNSETGSVENDSWRGHFRRALRHVAEHLVREGADKISIVLTGGASRMYFIDDDIRAIFGSGASIFAGHDKGRSSSVVKGLAWAGYAVSKIDAEISGVDEKVGGCKQKIKDKVQAMIVDNVFPAVKPTLASRFAECIKSYKTRGEIRSQCLKVARLEIAAHLGSDEVKEKIRSTFANVREIKDVVEIGEGVHSEFGRVEISLEFPDVSFSVPDFDVGGMGSLDLDSVWDTLFAPLLAVGRFAGKIINGVSEFFGGDKQFETDPEKEYLDSEKRKELAEDVEKSWQDSFWNGMRNRIEWTLGERSNYGGDHTFADAVTEQYLAQLVREKREELTALKGVFSRGE